MKHKLAVILAGILLSALPASGQRTAPGSGFISADLVITFDSFGGQLAYGRYFQHFYVMGGVNGAFRSQMQPLSTNSSAYDCEYSMPYCQITATADWMYRFFGSRSRVFTLNGGAGVLLGAEVYDPFGRRPRNGTVPDRDASFIYGFDVRLEMEIFAFRRTAFVVGGRLPFTFGTECSISNYEIGIGLRFNL